MRHPLERILFAILLTVMALRTPVRAADTAESIIAKAHAEADRAEAKVDEEIAKAKAEIRRAEAAIDRAADPDRHPSGSHGGNHEPVVQIGQSIHVKTNETVRDLVVVFGDAIVDGTVEGNLVVVLGEARVNGTVEGNLLVVLGEARVNGRVTGNAANVGMGLTIGPGAVVGGTPVGVLGGVDVASSAKVGGEVVHVKLEDLGDFTVPDWVGATFRGCVLKGRPLALSVGWVWVAAGMFLLGYIVLAAVFPKPVGAAAEALENRGATSFLMGLFALPLAAFVSIILFVTVAGWVVLPFVGATLLVATLFGKAAVLLHLGRALSRQFKAGLAMPALLLIGGVVLSLFYLIPFVGIVVWMVITPWGLGAALLALGAGLRRERAPVPAPRAFRPEPVTATDWTHAAATSGPVSTGAGPVPVPSPSPIAPDPIIPAPGSPAPSDAAALGFATATAATEPVIDAVPASGAGEGPSRPASMPFRSPPRSASIEEDPLLLPRVGLGRRAAAGFLDLVVIAFIVHGRVLGWLPDRDFLHLLLFLGYFVGMHLWRATTLGGLVLGLKVVRLDGRRIDFPCAIVRALGSIFSGMVGGLGFFWCAWDDERQTWHDKLAGTVVVRVEKMPPLV